MRYGGMVACSSCIATCRYSRRSSTVRISFNGMSISLRGLPDRRGGRGGAAVQPGIDPLGGAQAQRGQGQGGVRGPDARHGAGSGQVEVVVVPAALVDVDDGGG